MENEQKYFAKVLVIISVLLILIWGVMIASHYLQPRVTYQSDIVKNTHKNLALAVINKSFVRSTPQGEEPCFLPAYTVDADRKPLHSWRTLILPYINEMRLYEQIRLDEPWDSPWNSQFHTKMPRMYRAPGRPKEEELNGLTVYQWVIGPECVSDGPLGRRLSEIEAEAKFFLVESSEPVCWMSPVDLPQSALDLPVMREEEKDSPPQPPRIAAFRSVVISSRSNGSVDTISPDVSSEELKTIFLYENAIEAAN